ncbi:hypothetical protein SAMN05518865_11861 [Duganella sp. CF458]|uniref:hypothetical protein n=1 Tax=Duganella sp. CF458 TaxID=1884368 RepID=UPI0008E5AC4D|nr:hypothetical protein [Duganella sp. CF458]SFG77798.1 hypothetical protein SAMN05518865_11861 [Duganella sp. CF458]
MVINVQVWNEQTLGKLDIETVRALYQPYYRFRVQQAKYNPHTPYPESGVARTYYVVAGRMTVQDGPTTYVLESGQFVSLPRGTYTLHHPDGVEFIKVLMLSEQVWEHEKNLYETEFRPNLQTIDYRLV